MLGLTATDIIRDYSSVAASSIDNGHILAVVSISWDAGTYRNGHTVQNALCQFSCWVTYTVFGMIRSSSAAGSDCNWQTPSGRFVVASILQQLTYKRRSVA